MLSAVPLADKPAVRADQWLHHTTIDRIRQYFRIRCLSFPDFKPLISRNRFICKHASFFPARKSRCRRGRVSALGFGREQAIKTQIFGQPQRSCRVKISSRRCFTEGDQQMLSLKTERLKPPPFSNMSLVRARGGAAGLRRLRAVCSIVH